MTLQPTTQMQLCTFFISKENRKLYLTTFSRHISFFRDSLRMMGENNANNELIKRKKAVGQNRIKQSYIKDNNSNTDKQNKRKHITIKVTDIQIAKTPLGPSLSDKFSTKLQAIFMTCLSRGGFN